MYGLPNFSSTEPLHSDCILLITPPTWFQQKRFHASGPKSFPLCSEFDPLWPPWASYSIYRKVDPSLVPQFSIQACSSIFH